MGTSTTSSGASILAPSNRTISRTYTGGDSTDTWTRTISSEVLSSRSTTMFVVETSRSAIQQSLQDDSDGNRFIVSNATSTTAATTTTTFANGPINANASHSLVRSTTTVSTANTTNIITS